MCIRDSCYICEFDKIITKVGTPIIEILDTLFRTFDGFCANHGVQKIETVGYTYLACAGLRACEGGVPQHLLQIDPTQRIVEMAVEMMDYVKTRRIGGIQLKMKVGVNRGPVIAGVIGFHKPQFSLIGDTVNTTSRICATTFEGAIAISKPVYELVKGLDFRFTERAVQMKGKGLVVTYVCEKKRYLWRQKLSSALRKEQMIQGITRKQMNALRKLATTNQDLVKQKLGSIIKAKSTTPVPARPLAGQKTIVERSRTIAALNNEVGLDVSDMQGEDYLGGLAPEEERFGDKVLKPTRLLTFRTRQSNNVFEFNHQLDLNKRVGYTFLLVFIFMVHLLQTIILFSVMWVFPLAPMMIAFRFGFNLMVVGAIVCRKDAYKSRWIQAWIIFMYVYGAASVLLETGLLTPDSNERISLGTTLMGGFHRVDIFQVVFIMTFAMFSNGIFFIHSLLLFILIFGCFLAAFLANDALSYENVSFFLIFSAFILIQKYRMQRNDIETFNNIAIKVSRKVEEEELVSNLLPLHIAEKYFSNRSGSKLEFTNLFRDVTMLFADIKGFTDYSAGHSPQQVVEMLSELFTEFDKKCYKYGLYKLYTIGDCYVCMSFNDARNRNPGKEALNMVRFSLSLLEIISKFRKSRGLDMRIGIHTGECIGGVIGTDIVRYDFYGKDVLIANKMESNGVEGKIHISETTKNMLQRYCPGMFRFDYHGMVEAKSLNFSIEGYMLYENESYHEEGQELFSAKATFKPPK
eukprot:TRINITY_DN3964_c0_g2_i2.p1 TRINITY_DN3964_c0_g2~~TRINITY_DN3964_c0_g2_i2.p1  ORF type:complete len:760 (+),score=197.16 TRINITY_DN3964_c0_g2_i2:41-2281(+)